jgi:hypothetical protein
MRSPNRQDHASSLRTCHEGALFIVPKLPLGFRERFSLFAKTIPQAECIDDLPQTEEQRAAKKADFFFENRQIVCEVKNLETDTSPKVEKLLKPLEKRPEWPRFYGAWDLSKILRKFPDGAEINREVFESTTSAIRKAVADANRQIRATKQTFRLPTSGGMLVLANESIAVLSPEVIAHRVHRMLNKRTPDGKPQFPEINMVWMLSEKHVVEVRPGLNGIACLLLRQEIADPIGVQDFVESLQPRWAEFHSLPHHTVSGATLSDVEFKNNPNLEPRGSTSVTRAEFWRQQYQAKPYLRDLSDRRLIKHAGRLFALISPGFLRGCSEQDRARTFKLMPEWTHFLEEVNRRGMDMRDIAPAIRPIKRRLRFGQSVEPIARLGRNDLCPCTSGKKFKDCHGRPDRSAGYSLRSR